LADLTVLVLDNSAMKVVRTGQHISRAATHDLFIARQISGRVAMEHDGREIIAETGDILLLDSTLPYSASFTSESVMLLVKVPRLALEARLGTVREVIARPVKTTAGEAGLVSSFLAALPAHVGSLGMTAQQMVREQVLDLASIALASETARKPRLSSAQAFAAMKVRAAIDARLSDPGLDADSVANAAGVSVRYANLVLSREGESIMRRIQTRRLARCRQAIADPLQAHRTLTEIAYAWGFSDMTHFARRFRAAYGILPNEYRYSVQVNNGAD
jgi:AraC family transcriptional regulator, positive regulator of tynA and feaB